MTDLLGLSVKWTNKCSNNSPPIPSCMAERIQMASSFMRDARFSTRHPLTIPFLADIIILIPKKNHWRSHKQTSPFIPVFITGAMRSRPTRQPRKHPPPGLPDPPWWSTHRLGCPAMSCHFCSSWRSSVHRIHPNTFNSSFTTDLWCFWLWSAASLAFHGRGRCVWQIVANTFYILGRSFYVLKQSLYFETEFLISEIICKTVSTKNIEKTGHFLF